jgi:NitT/TauT family transport system permease protein
MLAYGSSFIVLLLLWQAIPTYWVNPAFFATPMNTLLAAIGLAQAGLLQYDIAISMMRIFIGFSLGSAIGVCIGLAMGSVGWIRKMLEPHLHFFRFVPSIAFVPLAILWFGIDEPSKIVLIVWTTNFIVLINTIAGVVAVPVIARRAAFSLGATPLQVLMHVTIPSVIPYSVAGMKLAMVNAFGTVIIAEMVASNQGLGYLILTAQFSFRIDRIFVGIATLAILGFLTDRSFRWLALVSTRKYGTRL